MTPRNLATSLILLLDTFPATEHGTLLPRQELRQRLQDFLTASAGLSIDRQSDRLIEVLADGLRDRPRAI